MTDTAKLFWSEGEQAVLLPDEYRFATAEVSVRREGRKLILEPIGDTQALRDAPRSADGARPEGAGVANEPEGGSV